MAESKYKFLNGGSGRQASNKTYTSPDRKKARDELYYQLVHVIKRKRMLDYDRYRVLRLIIRKLREGTL